MAALLCFYDGPALSIRPIFMRRSGVSPAPVQTSLAAMSPTPKPGILEIAPYVPGRSTAPGAAKVHKLSSNESPLGPSPKALAALDEAKASLSLYPEGSARLLREAIGTAFCLDPARLG